VNLTILAFFKYFNFSIDNAESIIQGFGWNVDSFYLNIVLPVGISFYTFQTMSYSIDIYRNKLKSTNHFFDFALFVAYFPQLAAGPIERASNLLPLILRKRKVDREQIYRGVTLIFWGLFKKIALALGSWYRAKKMRACLATLSLVSNVFFNMFFRRTDVSV
jgi:D-alanyl-lipoteichoic acid acyltransferase DltB (MBOAT superfamily)